MKSVTTAAAPQPAGHYSQAVVHGGFVFVAGQLPLDPATGAVVGEGDIAGQARQTLANVGAILDAAGSGFDRVTSMTIYVTSHSHWAEVNRVYAEVLGEHRPARAIVPVGELKLGCLLEIQAVAAVSPDL